ncbi:MAG: hypothetical protein WB992_14300 [Bryobacteraceae bacterium]
MFRSALQGNSSRIILFKNIAAIGANLGEDGKIRMGVMSQLPEGADLEICGEGFNDRTIKVRWQEQFYFIFLQDVELPQTRTASA